MKLIRHAGLLFAALSLSSAAHAQNCSNLPTQFTGNEFPAGDFFTNFQNSCYLIPLAPQGISNTDLNDTYWQMFYQVDPRYQLIVVGNFPNARFFSLTAYDDHYLPSQAILDTNIVPLTSSYVNPFQPGTPYAAGQQYAAAVNFGGTPGTLETGCTMNSYNVGVNSLDATLRHQGMNWNTDAGFLQQTPDVPLHVVDTPQHTNPPAAGYLMARMYLDVSQADSSTVPSVIVRDVASGCAYPAAYALQTLQVVSPAGSASWLSQAQLDAHKAYADYLPALCYAANPENEFNWSRQTEFLVAPNPYSTYLNANVPSNLPATLAAAGEVMRFRLRIPSSPPTPCTNGCSRSGNEQVRYVGLSFYPPSGEPFASLADSYFTTDSNGYATLIVGTGAAVPSWITPANGYTFLNLAAISGYNDLSFIEIRDILPSDTFACTPQAVPYNTSVYTPAGSMIGDYLPVVDYPLAASLPPMASELVGPNSCGGVLPAGVPAVSPSCGVLPPNPTAIASIPAPAPGESPVAAQPLPPITLMGVGFGFLPDGLPFTGNSNYLQVTDLTQNWSAGSAGNPCNLSIGYWADNRIEMVANVDDNGLCPLAAGDELAVSVWNPQTGGGPVTSTATVAQPESYWLATSSVLVGGAAGNGTVELMTSGPWTAASDSSWLHLSPQSANGVGGALIQFAYDANANPAAQTGTLTISGLTFTVTQAGAGDVPAYPVTTLISSGLNAPRGLAVDGQGNVYIADSLNNAIKQWNAGTGQVNTLVSSGLNTPSGVAVDTYGNVYIADTSNNAIKEWNAGNGQVTTLVSSGLSGPAGVGVDGMGNVYFSDAGHNALKESFAGSGAVATLAASGLSGPRGIALDAFGNVYIASSKNNTVEEWNAASTQISTMVSSGLKGPYGVAVDGGGNAYIADSGNKSVQEWNAATQQVTTLVSSGLSAPSGVATDTLGNVYIADTGNNAVKKLSPGYLLLGAASLNEGTAAGTDSVTAQLLPAGTLLTAVSNRAWLTITGTANGNVAFSFSANTSANSRTASITVYGSQVTVTQSGDTVASIAKTAGASQTALAGQAFATALEVKVKDSAGNPVKGAAVTFNAVPGANGASGMFSPSPPMPILTNASGFATAPTLTANTIAGAFTVSASVGDLTTNFSLTVESQ